MYIFAISKTKNLNCKYTSENYQQISNKNKKIFLVKKQYKFLQLVKLKI